MDLGLYQELDNIIDRALQQRSSNKTILGTVYGVGYDCRTDSEITFEGDNNGIWNKVSYHVPWLRRAAARLGEELCS